MFEENTFRIGAAFVSKGVGFEVDDGWIITFVHNEDTDISKVSQVGILQLAYWEFSLCYYKLKDILFSLQVHIIDTKNFSSEPVVKIRLPCRVPYGFHGAFMPMSL